MNQIVTAAAPALGAVVPGNLYVDLQSRSLWLGVSPSVDPSGSVLISDMVALMEEIADSEARSKAYTDTGLLAKANTVHVHTASQITDFNAAVSNVIVATPGLTFLRGMVMMFSGDPTLIGSGAYAGWALCNGAAFDIPRPGGGTDHVVTPNLTDKFVLGVGTYTQGQTNPKSTADTSDAGAHNHTNTPYALTLANLPAHSHLSGTLGGKAVGNVNPAGSHNHFITMCSAIQAGGVYRPQLVQAANSINVYTETEAAHVHAAPLVLDVNTGSTANAGSGTAHTHVMSNEGAHKHTISAAELRAAVPFYAMAYIMKL